MKWTRSYPTEPGFYWIKEPGEDAYLVRVCVEVDSHSMFYVMLTDDEQKYPIELWEEAFWFGPITLSH